MKCSRIIFLLLLGLFFVTRLYNLTLIPITNDEANYIFWAKQIAVTNRGWFITLEAGKPPIFLWLIVFFLKILPNQAYLLAGRLPAVIGGIIAFLGIYKLTVLLFNSSKAGMIAAFLYIFCPFILFYDRITLYDSLLTGTTLWTMYFAIKTAKTRNFCDALRWGTALGFALLAKPTAIMLFGLSPLVFLLFGFDKNFRQNRKKFALMIISALSLSLLLNSFLVFSRGFYDYLTRALGYTPTPGQILSSPLDLLAQNCNSTINWLVGYLTLPLLLLSLISTIFLLLKQTKISWMLIALWLLPLLGLSLSARIYFPRYFLFVIPYFLIPTAYFASLNWKIFAVVLVILLPACRFDFLLLTKPENAPLPPVEDWQYISGHPSSWGFAPIYAYLDRQLPKGPVTLFVQGSFSHFPHAFDLYFWGQKNIQIYERWPLTQIDEQMIAAKRATQTFVVIGYDFAGVAGAHDDTLKRLPLKVVVTGLKPRGPDMVYLTTF